MMSTRYKTTALLVLMPLLITAAPFILRLRPTLSADVVFAFYQAGSVVGLILLVAAAVVRARTSWGWRAFFVLLFASLPTFVISLDLILSTEQAWGADLTMLLVAAMNHLVLPFMVICTFRACRDGEGDLFRRLLLSGYTTIVLSSITPFYWMIRSAR